MKGTIMQMNPHFSSTSLHTLLSSSVLELLLLTIRKDYTRPENPLRSNGCSEKPIKVAHHIRRKQKETINNRIIHNNNNLIDQRHKYKPTSLKKTPRFLSFASITLSRIPSGLP